MCTHLHRHSPAVLFLTLAMSGLSAKPLPAQAPAPAPSPFTPAFKNQTNAPAPATPSQFVVETVASGLAHPWSLAFLPDGRMLVSERPGQLRIVDRMGRLSEPIAGVPPIRSVGGEGLHDVVLDPDFATN